ncbi:hypothetical protein H4R34_001031 [Dimargaris verticillata]|uniref:Uncharacterized protein n=1 Tax=Dimargaris verticillata TaxID=2761393 RepID=A0A9W8BAN4_9FUNG|nr:hypothetical protein H4R34_001031 [Dimargaris verticillata]
MVHSRVKPLPHFTVQPDWQLDVSSVATGQAPRASFWLSVYEPGRTSLHTNVTVAPQVGASPPVELTCAATANGDTDTNSPPAVQISPVSRLGLQLHRPNGIEPPLAVCAPRRVTATPAASTAIASFDVSPGESLYVVGGAASQLEVIDAESGASNARLVGHKGDITSCRFFPSGQVVLSAASDWSLKIWSVADGSSPATLIGHHKTVTDTAIIDRGRTVVSASLDGTVRLWECGSSRELTQFQLAEDTGNTVIASSTVNAVHQLALAAPIGTSLAPTDAGGLSSDSQLCFAATESGALYGLDLQSGQRAVAITTSTHLGPRTAIAVSSRNHCVASGSTDGVVELWDWRNVQQPLAAFQRNGAAINDMLFLSENTDPTGMPPLGCVTQDGCAFIAQSTGTDESYWVTHELTGADIDPLTTIRVASAAATSSSTLSDTNRAIYAWGQASDHATQPALNLPRVYTAGRDGIVRQY